MRKVKIKEIEKEYGISEAYKSIRTNLQFCRGEKKIISVTSCLENEGKSTVVLNLAAALAETGKRVVILDADLRKSILRERTVVDPEMKGLAHYLSGQATMKEIICETDIKNLYLVYAGAVPPNPSELLCSNRFKNTLHSLNKVFDIILIDTPPLGKVIDGAIIAEASEGAVLVIESDKVSYRFARDVKKQLEKSNCPILGVVLNKVEMTSNPYYGKKYEYKKED
ncbi:MAG: CpsD/CapB family tyrosine-protein kinase [Lachnospiraceae bacterium]|nr:CpsD/CapB family tyrosine-protein kinase [Lachnospiraceae bacterium]